jgi:hypothetical protein
METKKKEFVIKPKPIVDYSKRINGTDHMDEQVELHP